MVKSRKILFWILCVCCALAVVFHQYINKTEQTVAIVIPHHDMVASARDVFLKKVASSTQPDTIILISPDHFDAARAPLVTTDRTWNTISGDMKPDYMRITDSKLDLHDDAFNGEHGITSLIGPLRRAFPNARIVPILANRRATYSDVAGLAKRLHDSCSSTCLLVASIDFSHAHDRAVASLHDELAIRALQNSDSALAYTHAEVDSPESLTALIEWSRLSNAPVFDIFSHTNSGILHGQRSGEMTTHIMGEYRQGRQALRHTYSFMIGGDTMFARGVARHADPFRELGERFFWGVDDAVLNLEGVFSAQVSESERQEGWTKMPPVLAFDSRYVQTLKKSRVSVVGMQNNHSADMGEAGHLFTVKRLKEANIIPVEEGRTEEIGVYIPNNTSIPVAYITVNAIEHVPNIRETMEELSEYRTIVYVHWGREYETTHNAKQESIAHELVDLGADLVVGSHPHVIQDAEIYRNVPILYSLGNFLFDQDQKDATMQGLVVGGVFDENGLTLYPIPVYTFLKTEPMVEIKGSSAYEQILEKLSPFRVSDDSFFIPYLD